MRARRSTGGRVFVRGRISAATAGDPAEFPVSCGQCIGCLLERSRQWAVRMSHEALVTQPSCFLTLTISDEEMPGDQSLDVVHWQSFARRVRRALGPFRFFACGEYGSRTRRPHYHAAVFGLDFREDRVFHSRVRGGHSLYTSVVADDLWRLGAVRIGELTFDSAAYVARYVTKRLPSNRFSMPGDRAGSLRRQTVHLARTVDDPRRSEFALMSRRPGIGGPFFEKYWQEIYPRDTVVVRGREERPPRYYDQLLERRDPALWEKVKAAREAAVKPLDTWERQNERSRMRRAVTDTVGRDMEN